MAESGLATAAERVAKALNLEHIDLLTDEGMAQLQHALITNEEGVILEINLFISDEGLLAAEIVNRDKSAAVGGTCIDSLPTALLLAADAALDEGWLLYTCPLCDGDGFMVVGWDTDAYENIEGCCPRCGRGEGGG